MKRSVEISPDNPQTFSPGPIKFSLSGSSTPVSQTNVRNLATSSYTLDLMPAPIIRHSLFFSNIGQTDDSGNRIFEKLGPHGDPDRGDFHKNRFSDDLDNSF